MSEQNPTVALRGARRPDAAAGAEPELPSDSLSIPVELSLGDGDQAQMLDVLRREGEARYREVGVLGRGGFGEVASVCDERLGREVAWKTSTGSNGAPDELQRRFFREARIQGQLEHPSIVPVYDFGLDADGEMYFTMRRVQGQTLSSILRELRLHPTVAAARYTRRRLLTALVSVCRAVHYAHTRSVIHRDLKPANIMLGEFGEVYVLDWGLAKILGVPDPHSVNPGIPSAGTVDGTALGTVGYMAPEQLRGENSQLDGRTDVYSLGVILFETLTRQPFVRKKKLGDILQEIIDGIDARPSLRDPRIPTDLDAICTTATAPQKEARYATAGELAEAIERFLDGDRDEEARTTRAGEHTRRALEAYEASRAAGLPQETLDALRGTAFREATAAIALAPEHPKAREMLTELLVQTPGDLPPEGHAELALLRQRERQDAVRYSSVGYALFLLCMPFLFAVGILERRTVLWGTAMVLLSAGYSLWLWRSGRVSGAYTAGLAVASGLTMAWLSTWLGPFVLVPTATTASVLLYGFFFERSERRFIGLTGVLAIVVPFALEHLGVIAPSMTFTPQGLLFHPRSLALPPLPTTAALVYTSLTFVLFPLHLLGRIRDRLRDAEAGRFRHDWHLRRLLATGTAAPPSTAA